MAETTQAENNGNSVDPEAKFKRCQEIGLSFILAIPVALMLLAMYQLGHWSVQISMLLGVIGAVFFFFGHIGREELADKQKEEVNPPDCPK